MAGPRQIVRPPAFESRDYGLSTVVETRFEEPDVHWRNGVQWESQCGLGGSTYDDFCLDDSPAKTRNITTAQYGATPFVPFVEVDCPPIGYSEDEQFERARSALLRVEWYQVENAFWTGNVSASGARAFPHLAANAAVTDATINPSVLLQTATSTASGSPVMDVVEGIARLEGMLARCANGRGVLHVTPEVGDLMASQLLLAGPRGGVMFTQLGNKVAIGAGYPGTAPDGTSTNGVHWAYATSPVFAYRSADMRVGMTIAENLDRSVNTVKTQAERVYVLGYDCCHFGVPISLGGVISGSYNSAG